VLRPSFIQPDANAQTSEVLLLCARCRQRLGHALPLQNSCSRTPDHPIGAADGYKENPMTKTILMAAVAFLALSASPAFAEAKVKPGPAPMSSVAQKVHAKKVHANVVRQHKLAPRQAPVATTLNERERAMTRDLNRNGIQRS
jgi:hypothetical protein